MLHLVILPHYCSWFINKIIKQSQKLPREDRAGKWWETGSSVQGPGTGWTRALISRERQTGHERRRMKKRGDCGRLDKKTSVIGNEAVQCKKDWDTGKKANNRNEWVGNRVRSWWTSAEPFALTARKLEMWTRKGFGERQNASSLVKRLHCCSEPERESKTLRSRQYSSVNIAFINTWQNIYAFSFWN